MNWTGGAFPRSRNGNAKATLTNLQKKHFAKVRGKLLSAPASSPEFDPAIFKDAGNRHSRPQQDTSRKATRQKHQTQTRLEAYDNVAPAIRKLASIRPYKSYASPHSGSTYGRTSLGVLELAPHPSQPHVEGADNSFRPNVAQHDTSGVQLPHPDPSTESFEAKRQDLLRRADWVGLANTKPVEIQFSTAKERDRIGKRRRLDSAEQKVPQSQLNKQQRLAYNLYEDRRPSQRYRQPSSSLGDISVRIGDSEEGHNACSRGPANPAKQYWYGSTPDEMLFDRELSIQGSVHGQDMELTARLHPTVTETSSVSARHSQANGRTTPASMQTSWAGFSPWAEVEDMMIRVKQEPDHDEHKMNLREAAPVWHAPHLNDKPWAGIPGLPLIFSSNSQEPIEVSSGSDSASVIESEHYAPVQDETNGTTATRNYQVTASKTDHNVRAHGELISFKSSRRTECESPWPKGPFHESADVQELSAGAANRRAESLGREEETLDIPVQMRTYTAPEPKMSSMSWWVADKESRTPAKTLETPKNVSAVRAAAPSHPMPPRSPTLADEELIWRKFVFGSSDADPGWTLEDPPGTPPTPNLPSADHSSSPTTTRKLNQSSLFAEAPSSSYPLISTTTTRSSSPDHYSLAAQPSTTQSLHPFDSTSSSYFTTTPSLPSHPLRSPSQTLSPSKSSLQAQDPASTSPPRTQHTRPSLSSDELATTPARPTFVFRKPARYVAREGGGLGRIHLGRGTGGRGRRRAREVEVWDEGEDGGGGGMVGRVEDEIEDDLA